MFKLTQFGALSSAVVALILVSFPIGSRAADKDVIINEIMYHPPLEMEELQYVELFNRGNGQVDLSQSSSPAITETKFTLSVTLPEN